MENNAPGGEQQASGVPLPTGTPTPPTEAPWYGEVDEATSAYITNKAWKGPGDLLTSYRNLEKHLGGSKDIISLPGADADETEIGEFYGKLGRPDSADKYTLQAPEGADKELLGWYRETAHKLGLTDSQAKALYAEYSALGEARSTQAAEHAQVQAEAEIASLRTEWGKAFDSQIAAGRNAVKALGLSAEKVAEYESKLGTGEMLRLFATLGSRMGESSFEGSQRTGVDFNSVTPALARQQIQDLRTDTKFMEKYMQGDKDAVARMSRLMGQAHGG